MAELANQADAVELLVDGARYGDLEDVQIALDEYKVSPDAADEQHRTGLSTPKSIVTAKMCQVQICCAVRQRKQSMKVALVRSFIVL